MENTKLPRLNSTGLPITESEECLRAFWCWFDESRVTDVQTGKPLVVYHGTGESFGEFQHGYDDAMYFTPSPEVASAYALANDRDRADPLPNVMPVYLSIKNPKVMSDEDLDGILGAGDKRDWHYMFKVIEHARRQGFDGILIEGSVDYSGEINGQRREDVYDQWIAFEPEQIKSAIGNPGTFNKHSKHVTDGRELKLGEKIDMSVGIGGEAENPGAEAAFISKYMMGHCDAMAIALASCYDLPIRALFPVHVDASGAQRVDPDFVHVYAMDGDQAWDARGKRSETEALEEFRDYLTLLRREGDVEVRTTQIDYDDAEDFIETSGCDISMVPDAVRDAKRHLGVDELRARLTLKEFESSSRYKP